MIASRPTRKKDPTRAMYSVLRGAPLVWMDAFESLIRGAFIDLRVQPPNERYRHLCAIPSRVLDG